MINVSYTIWCDAKGCLNWYSDGQNIKKELRKDAKIKGWTIKKHGHFCPRHSIFIRKSKCQCGNDTYTKFLTPITNKSFWKCFNCGKLSKRRMLIKAKESE